MLAKVAAALPFAFCRKEKMELLKEFGNVDFLPIGEDVRHLDEQSNNIIINDMLAVKYAMLFAEQEQK